MLQPNSLASTHRPLEHGRMKVKFTPLEPPLDNVECSSLIINPYPPSQTTIPNAPGSEQFTVGCPVHDKKTTSSDRSLTCKNCTQTTRSSLMSVQELASSVKRCCPFWTHRCKEWSQKLWSPVVTASVDLPSSYWNGFSQEVVPSLPSFCKVMHLQNQNSQMMSFPSFRFSVAEEMASEDTQPPEVMKTIKLHLRLTPRQRRVIRSWEGAYRFTYNSVLDYIKQNPKTGKSELRDRFVTLKQNNKTLKEIEKGNREALFGPSNFNPFLVNNPFLKNVPKALRQQAAYEAYTNFRTARKIGGTCDHKKKGESSWTIRLEDQVRLLRNHKVRLVMARTRANKSPPMTFRYSPGHKNKLPVWLNPDEGEEEELRPPCDAKIQMAYGEFYLLLSYKNPNIPFPGGTGHILSLDPGIRKFQVGYGTDGSAFVFGSKGLAGRFRRMQWYKDHLRTRLRAKKTNPIRATGKTKKRIKRKINKIGRRMEDIRKDFHHKIANYMTRHYKAVVIGKLPKHIISRSKGLPASVKRAYNAMGHYKFRNCLLDKCKARGVAYVEINESYTSKACTLCGTLNDVLGSSETFCCVNSECSSRKSGCCKWDRDLNGARNILLKTITESYLRIVVKDNKTLTLKTPSWTKNPPGRLLFGEVIKGF